MGITSREPGTLRGTARIPHFSRAFISVTVQVWSQMFWVISVYFNIRNTLPKSGTFFLGHPVYTNTLYITIIVVFLTALLHVLVLLSSKIHSGDDIAEDPDLQI